MRIVIKQLRQEARLPIEHLEGSSFWEEAKKLVMANPSNKGVSMKNMEPVIRRIANANFWKRYDQDNGTFEKVEYGFKAGHIMPCEQCADEHPQKKGRLPDGSLERDANVICPCGKILGRDSSSNFVHELFPKCPTIWNLPPFEVVE